MDAYQEHLNSLPDSIAEAERGIVLHLGARKPQQCWILSDRDVWYRNPYYVGPVEPHPEDQPYEQQLRSLEDDVRFGTEGD